VAEAAGAAVAVRSNVGLAVLTGVPVAVLVAVPVLVDVPVAVLVTVEVPVPVAVGVDVRVGLGVMVAVRAATVVGDAVAVAVLPRVAVADDLAVALCACAYAARGMTGPANDAATASATQAIPERSKLRSGRGTIPWRNRSIHRCRPIAQPMPSARASRVFTPETWP